MSAQHTPDLVQERDAFKARLAELQARNTKLVKILAGIHELLHPPLIEHDGKTFKFVNPDANAVLEELSSRIRAIPDSIDALPNEQGGHIARLERDAARHRWLKLQPWNMWGPNVVSGPRSEHVGNLDAAIDTAMASSKEAPNQTLPQVAGTVPQRARKIGGSYQADGTIVAQFKTLGGADRVVFEFDEPAGMLHIFASEQVELREVKP